MTDRRVLIVDDEPDIRFLLSRTLISNGYVVSEADSLQKGIELYKKKSPEIVILDVNLPDGNALGHTKEFKTDNILILISADHDELVENYKKYNANGFLKKPFTPAELLNMIKQHTQKELT